MGTSVRLNGVMVGFPHVFEAHTAPGSDKASYSIECIFPPDRQDILQSLEKAFVATAYEAGKQALVQQLKRPWVPGDRKNQEQMAKGKNPRQEIRGMVVLRASSQSKPGVFDQMLTPIPIEQRENLFSGCICNVHIDLFWSSNVQNPGIFCALNGVQLVSNVNVTRFGPGPKAAEEMFEPVSEVPQPQQPPWEPQPQQPPWGQQPQQPSEGNPWD